MILWLINIIRFKRIGDGGDCLSLSITNTYVQHRHLDHLYFQCSDGFSDAHKDDKNCSEIFVISTVDRLFNVFDFFFLP